MPEFFILRKRGDPNPRYGKPVRQFSKLVVSATHPHFLLEVLMRLFVKRGAKVAFILIIANF